MVDLGLAKNPSTKLFTLDDLVTADELIKCKKQSNSMFILHFRRKDQTRILRQQEISFSLMIL